MANSKKVDSAPTTDSRKFRANGVMKCERFGTVLRWTFKDGNVMECDVAAIPVEVQEDAKYHGIKQRLGDAAAMGQTATVAEKRAEMVRVRDALLAGNWNIDREATGPRIGDLVAALAILKPNVTEAKIREKVAGYSTEERRKLSKRPDVAEEIAKMEVARAKASGSDKVADGLFDELDS